MKKPHLIFQLDRIFCSVWLRLRLRLLRATDTRHFKWFTPTDIKSQHRSKLVPVQWSDQILSAVCWSGTFDNTPPNSRNYNSENTNGEFVFFGTFGNVFYLSTHIYMCEEQSIRRKYEDLNFVLLQFYVGYLMKFRPLTVTKQTALSRGEKWETLQSGFKRIPACWNRVK